MPSTSLRASRLTAVAAASGATNWLNRATWRLFDAQGNLSPLVTATRSGTATFFNSSGVLQNAAANTPRVSYDPAVLSIGPFLLAEEQRTNSIRNNTMQGAAAGTEPINWIVSGSGNGLTRNIAVGTENGIPYVDIGWSGTPTNSGTLQIFYEPNTQIVATNGQSWTNSVNMKLAGGTVSGIGVIRQNIRGNTLAGSAVVGQTAFVDWQSFISSSASLSSQRRSVTITFTDATVERVAANVAITYTVNVPINFTLRIGLPQLELGATASSPILTYGTAVTRSADNNTVNLAGTGYNVTESTVYADCFTSNRVPDRVVFDIGAGGAFGTTAYVTLTSTNTALNPSIAPLNISSSVAVTDNSLRVAAVLRRNDCRIAAAGQLGGLDVSCEVPSNPTTLTLGRGGWSGAVNPLNGGIRQLAIIPQRVSDSGLQRLTRI